MEIKKLPIDPWLSVDFYLKQLEITAPKYRGYLSDNTVLDPSKSNEWNLQKVKEHNAHYGAYVRISHKRRKIKAYMEKVAVKAIANDLLIPIEKAQEIFEQKKDLVYKTTPFIKMRDLTDRDIMMRIRKECNAIEMERA